MAKDTVAPTPPTGQAILLKDISITWTVGTEPLTITGCGLARVLYWLGKTRGGSLEDFGNPEEVADILEAISNLQKDHVDPIALSAREVLWGLSLLNDDCAGRLLAGFHGGELAKVATVTIAPAKKSAVA
jgi:hypothetical protein